MLITRQLAEMCEDDLHQRKNKMWQEKQTPSFAWLKWIKQDPKSGNGRIEAIDITEGRQ